MCVLVQNSSYDKISTNYPVIIRDNMVPLIFHDGINYIFVLYIIINKL